LASANTIASAAIAATSSPVRMFGADTPMKTSAPRTAPARSPSYPPALVRSATQRRLSVRPGRPWCTAPLSSQMITSLASGSWVSRQTGQASMPANRLNSAALPSITGSAA
jgi:hypothetical protein